MLRHVLFDLGLFETEADRANSQKRVLCLLEALKNCNRYYLQQHPNTPLIYQAGIKYKVPAQYEREHVPEVAAVRAYLERKGAPVDVMGAFKALADQVGVGENFREIPRIIENGGGDCDNVSSWRCAELQELGIDAKPYITWRKRPDGGTTYHVIVRWPDGSSEDPSLLLGMGGPERAADRAEEERKLGERMGEFVAGLQRTRNAKQAIETVFGGGGRRFEHGDLDIFGLLAATPFSAQSSPQNFNQLQYTIPFQTDDSYESWSPTRPQGFYNNPLYPNLPSTPGGMPMFNTRMRDFDDDFDDRFDGDVLAGDEIVDLRVPYARRRLRPWYRRALRAMRMAR